MRRILIFILCCALLSGTVFAAGRADEVRNTTVVYTDGSADVVLAVTITLTQGEALDFPVPREATDVRLNDRPVEPVPSRENESVSLVDLTTICTRSGTYELVFRYSLPPVIRYNEQKGQGLILELPLLSGFEYPVDAMNFSVTFPEGVEVSPNFYSGYFLQSIESNMEYTIKNGILTGSVNTTMKDRETLMVTMDVDAEGFPELVILDENANTHLYIMSGVAALALVFWLIFLPSLPVWAWRTRNVPAGVHAGEVASWLAMEGGDLTMMVFHWAKLGYIHIAPDRRDRVWLHKRMEMGNERTPFEVRIFRQLFGRNQMVEGTGTRYARLWHQVHATIDRADQITRGGLGARVVFRAIAVVASTFAGAAMGQNFIEAGGYWELALMMGLAIAGTVMGWKIQSAAACLHLRRRDALPVGLVCCALWMIIAVAFQHPVAGGASVVVQILAGIFAAWGGRRTKVGRETACWIQGLRRYLVGAKSYEIRDELERDPDYFFEMAPYALAMGVEERFAKRFGRAIMPQCCYLDAGRSEKRNAQEWAYIMGQTARKLDDSAKQIRRR